MRKDSFCLPLQKHLSKPVPSIPPQYAAFLCHGYALVSPKPKRSQDLYLLRHYLMV